MTDFFPMLKVGGAGGELAGNKRGVNEMAEGNVINKADGENLKSAKIARLEFKRALHLYPPKSSDWQPNVLLCSALDQTGISEIWELIQKYQSLVKKNDFFTKNRREQNKFWLLQTIDEHLKNRFYQDPKIKKALQEQLTAIENNETTPFIAAEYLLELSKTL